MPDTSQSVEQQAQSSFVAGVFTGSLGCLTVLVAGTIGLVVGFQIGHELFDWHYGEAVQEMRKHEPLQQWSWSCQGALIGGVTLPVITLICWSVLGSWISRFTQKSQSNEASR